MRVLTHGTIQKLYSTAMLLQFFQQQNLMNIVASQAVGRRNQYKIQLACCCLIPQPIQAGTLQGGSTVPVISKDVFNRYPPVLLAGVAFEPI
jgi:hypothetical protein